MHKTFIISRPDQRFDDDAEDDAQEGVGSTMLNASLVNRLSRTAYANVTKP